MYKRFTGIYSGSHRSRRKLWLFLGSGLILISLTAYWYHLNQAPAVGIIKQSSAKPSRQAASEPTGKTHFAGKAVTFDYPSTYRQLESNPVVAPVIEAYSFSFREGLQESRRISITVKRPLESISITEDSAYAFRKLQTEQYEPSDVVIANRGVKKMAKKDGTEISYFVSGTKAYAIITVTTTNPVGSKLPDDVLLVVSSLVWL